jgi:lysine-N-methylase
LERFGEEDELLSFQQRSADYQVGENEYCNTMRKMFRSFGKLEVLNADWPEYVKRVEVALFGEGQRVYIDKQVAFHKASGEQWSIWLEQMMVYYVFTYFCGAVYDGNVIGKIKTAIFCTIMFQEFAIAKWQPTDGAFSFQLVLDIAHRISREVEHSDVNLVRLEKIFEKTPIFETKELLKYCIFCGNTL